MRALVCRTLAEDLDGLAIEELELPALSPEEVRIRVGAAAANFPDILMAQGKYHFRPEPPFIIGGECAGEVVAVGEAVRGIAPGDRVVGGDLTGGFAQLRHLGQNRVRPIPAGIDFATAAAFTTAYLTAYVSLVRRGEIERGETLLVHGAAGGVGLAAVDLGRALGVRVIATASSEDKRAFLRDYGADHVLPSSGFRDAVKDLTRGRGADVIYDPVGGAVFDESVRCIAFGGRLLVVGFASGRIGQLPSNLALIKGFSLVGVRAGEYSRHYPEKGRQNLAAIDELLEQGKLRPHICARFGLEQATNALKMLQTRKAIGKVIVEP